MKKVILSIAFVAAGLFTLPTIQAANTINRQPVIEATSNDDEFVTVKFDELNEKVQAAINALKETCEVDSIMYNAEKQITKVEVTIKEDQSKKTIYLDNEGAATTWKKPVGDVVKEKETEGAL